MIIFILNILSVSAVMMGAVVLITLRERTDTQILLAGIMLEALVALGSLMWIDPGQLDARFLTIRMIGRIIETGAMGYVIMVQVKALRRSALSPTASEAFTKELEDLKQQLVELKKEKVLEETTDAPTH